MPSNCHVMALTNVLRGSSNVGSFDLNVFGCGLLTEFFGLPEFGKSETLTP